jgi:hypothetical protein
VFTTGPSIGFPYFDLIGMAWMTNSVPSLA